MTWVGWALEWIWKVNFINTPKGSPWVALHTVLSVEKYWQNWSIVFVNVKTTLEIEFEHDKEIHFNQSVLSYQLVVGKTLSATLPIWVFKSNRMSKNRVCNIVSSKNYIVTLSNISFAITLAKVRANNPVIELHKAHRPSIKCPI